MTARPTTLFKKLLEAAQSRYRRARPGSVLIMVVSLLVLLALIGTAAMSTARVDRVGSRQNVLNTQIDLLVEGVRQMVMGELIKDVLSSGRNLTDSPASTIEEANSLAELRDVILASRFPERLWRFDHDTTGGRWKARWADSTHADGPDPIIWRYLSYPPFINGGGSVFMFNPPNQETVSNPMNFAFRLPKWMPAEFNPRQVMPPPYVFQPTWMQLANGDVIPALRVLAMDGLNPGLTSRTDPNASIVLPAADADGDGIADSLLWKLPGTPIDGVSYYAAIRVIDHNSAVNVNTAWRYWDNDPRREGVTWPRDNNPVYLPLDVAFNPRAMKEGEQLDTPIQALLVQGWFPYSVDLQGLLSRQGAGLRRGDPGLVMDTWLRPEEMFELNRRRFGFPAASTPYTQRFDESIFHPSLVFWVDEPDESNIFSNKTKKNGDLAFLTPGDLMWHQLGRRLANPGIYQRNVGREMRFGFNGTRPFGLTDEISLRYKFILRPSESSRTPVEASLPDSTFLNAPTQPFEFVKYANLSFKDQLTRNENALIFDKWFLKHFDFWPIPQMDPSAFRPPYAPANDPNNMWMWPQGWETGNPTYPYPTVQPTTSARALLTAYNPLSNHVWRHLPEFGAPYATAPWPNLREFDSVVANNAPIFPWFESGWDTKTNPNTAYLEEAWRAFYDVMADDRNIALPEFPDITAVHLTGNLDQNPYFGQQFDNPPAAAGSQTAPHLSQDQDHPSRMFRSSLRPPVGNFRQVDNHRLPVFHMMMIRSAIAAANLVDMRDLDNNVTTFRLKFPKAEVELSGGGNNLKQHEYDVMIFGTERQPFITEVYLNNNPNELDVKIDPNNPNSPTEKRQNPQGFAAIELHNPYDHDLCLYGWTIRLIERKLPGGAYRLKFDTATNTKRISKNNDPNTEFTFALTDVIPAHGFMVISNYDRDGVSPGTGDPDAAKYTPGGINQAGLMDRARTTGTQPGTKYVYIKELHKVLDHEFVLLRPLVEVPINANAANLATDYPAIVPIDSFDATGIEHKVATTGGDPNVPDPVKAWHYVRANRVEPPLHKAGWQFVYPGRYDGSQANRRHQGTREATWNGRYNAVNTEAEPWTIAINQPKPVVNFGRYDDTNSREGEFPAANNYTIPPTATAPNPWGFAIQILNHQMPGPLAPDNEEKPWRYPFGGFPRALDILSVPFIGAYYVFDIEQNQPSPAGFPFTLGNFPVNFEFIECNSLPMDSVFAEDSDIRTDPFEDIGRFAPLTEFLPSATGSLPLPTDLSALRATGGMRVENVNNEFHDVTREEPDGFWEGYEVYIDNPAYTPNPNETDPDFKWQRQVRRIRTYDYVDNALPRFGKFILDRDLKPPLNPGRLPPGKAYTYHLHRVRYSWAADILDYFSVLHTPADDFLPNFNPGQNAFNPMSARTDLHPRAPFYESREWNSAANRFVYTIAGEPKGVRNRAGALPRHNRHAEFQVPPQPTEDNVPSEGLININTANWRILATLPLVIDPTNGRVDRFKTEVLAKRIVYFRDVDDGFVPPPFNKDPDSNKFIPHPHGPFKSPMELNLVPGFADAMGTLDLFDPAQGHPLTYQHANLDRNPRIDAGDYSPFNADPDVLKSDRIRCDFEEKFLTLNRISNLITLRSDTFTAYILVQGWRDADTPNATLMTQRRAAFILDRSRVRKQGDQPGVYNVPMN